VDDMSGSSDASRSHTLIMTLCIEPPLLDDERYFQSDAVRRTLAGAVVYKALFRRFGMEFYDEVRHMASIFGRVGPAASAGGWLWEGWCHRHIADLTHLDLLPMVDDGKNLVLSNERPEKIQIGRLTHRLYTSKSTTEFTAVPGRYYIPSESNNATFDAFFRCEEEQKGICLQMTIRTEHSLAESGLKALEKRLEVAKERYFVFVIPKGQKFTCNVPTDKWRSVFKFFILELEDGPMPLVDDTMVVEENLFDESVGQSPLRKRKKGGVGVMGGGGPTTARGVDGVEGEDGEEGSVNSSESYMPAPKKTQRGAQNARTSTRVLRAPKQGGAQRAKTHTRVPRSIKPKGSTTQGGTQNARTSTRVLRSVKSKESTQGGSESEDEH